MKYRASYIVPCVVGVMAIGLTVWMWQLKIQLGIHRYFEIDELAYLYWATHIQMGLKPYIDFLFYPAPGFFILLVPIVSAFQGIAVFAASRGAMLVVFASLSIALMLLFWELRRSWIAILIPLVLVFLPLPSDKFIEIRPDTLAMTLFIFGLWLQMRHMNGKQNTSLVAGLLYGASVAVSQKMAMTVGIALLGGVCWTIVQKQSWRMVKGITSGIGVVGAGVLFYLFSLGNFPMIWYSLTKFSFEASSLGKIFPIPPQFFFIPNDVVYGTGGLHIGYIANLALWIIGLCMAAVRLFSPYAISGKKGVWQEVTLTLVFYCSFLLFCYVLPMKHAQYLIPPAIFIVFYAVDGIGEIWRYLKRTIGGHVLFLILCSLAFYFFWRGYSLVTMPKLYWTNENDMQKVKTLWKNIPLTEPIFDMVGLTMRYPQPYIAPVYPIGQMAPVITYRLPPLVASLVSTDTKFIYSGTPERFSTLSNEDQLYIKERFTPVGDNTLWVRNDIVASRDWLEYDITGQ